MVAAFALGCDSPILFEHSPDALYLWLADSGTANSFFLRTCSEGFAFQQCITDLESLDSNLIFSLTDGGTAGIFWGFTVTVIASIFIYLSIGEMASMSPTAGDSTIGSLNMLLHGARSISATLQVNIR